jgi:hypothetical protein
LLPLPVKTYADPALLTSFGSSRYAPTSAIFPAEFKDTAHPKLSLAAESFPVILATCKKFDINYIFLGIL